MELFDAAVLFGKRKPRCVLWCLIGQTTAEDIEQSVAAIIRITDEYQEGKKQA